MAAARGLLIVIPLLIAAGVAVYESPQVRQFLDEHRRKIALALEDLGDQFTSVSGGDSQAGQQRSPMPGRRTSQDVASSREDASPEAEERRKRAREEIAERRRIMEERRGGKGKGLSRRGSSFDDMVDADGNLRGNTSGAQTSGIELGTLRRRNEPTGAVAGANFANPFSDEMQIDHSEHGIGLTDEELARQLQAHFDEEYADSQNASHQQRPDVPLSPQEIQELERIVRDEAERQGKELPEPGSGFDVSEKELMRNIDRLQAELSAPSDGPSTHRHTPAASSAQSTHTFPRSTSENDSVEGEGVLVDAQSTHPSETPLIDLTPTTSAPGTPRQAPREPTHQQSYQSIQDWAEQSTASFHSLYDSSVDGNVRPRSQSQSRRSEVSDLDSISRLSDADSEMDVISELGISTPGTWTEVGSVTSEENQQHDHHHNNN